MYALDCEDDVDEEDDMEYIDINDLPNDQEQYFLDNNGDDDGNGTDYEMGRDGQTNIHFNEIDAEEEDNYQPEGESDYEDELLEVYINGGDEADITNYKGIHLMQKDYDQQQAEEEKYQCPETGSHFDFLDMCQRLKGMQSRRAVIDKVIVDEENKKIAAARKNAAELSKV
jgi:hypothetical protein